MAAGLQREPGPVFVIPASGRRAKLGVAARGSLAGHIRVAEDFEFTGHRDAVARDLDRQAELAELLDGSA
jgi:hypothetical protein